MEFNFFELRRKFFHVLGGIVLISLIYIDLLKPWLLFLIILTALFLSYTSLKKKIPIVSLLIEKVERKNLRSRFPGKGVIFFLIGAFLTLVLFGKDICIASLVVLTLGDAIAPFIGGPYGKIRHPFSKIKFIEGTLAGTLAGTLGIGLLNLFGIIDVNIVEALLGSFVAMFAEGFEIDFYMDLTDDNIVVPLVAGSVIWMLRFLGF